MKLRLIPTLALLLCLSFHPAETRLVFSPAEGARVSKAFDVEFLFSLEDMTMTMNGQEMPFGMDDVGADETEGEFGYSLEVVDVFEAVSNGRPDALSRTYEIASTRYDVSGDSDESDMEELAGKTVRFEWNEEDGDYRRSWGEDSEGDEDAEILQALSVDLDMRALLPRGDVEEGDTWQVPLSELGSLFLPGLDPTRAAAAFAESDDYDGEFDDLPTQLLDPLNESLADAVLECTYRGLRGGDDGDVAVIALLLSTEASIDAAESLATAVSEADDEGFAPDVDEFAIDIALDCEGELVWDLERGVFEAFELEGEATIDVYLIAEIDAEGMGTFELEGEAELGLELSISASAE